MTFNRTVTFAGLALAASMSAALASPSQSTTRLPDMYVQQSAVSPERLAMPGFESFGVTGYAEGSQYTLYNKAPHNGFDLFGNGVHPPIGPITD